METIKYNGKLIDSDYSNNFNLLNSTNSTNSTSQNQLANYKKIDLFSIKNAYQSMIIQKTLEAHELISDYLKMTHPLTKMTLAFMLLNPFQTWMLVKNNSVHLCNLCMFMGRSFKAFVYRKPQPIKKTFEITYITDNSINHLYIAFDWYLKTNSKIKKDENYAVISMIKPIEASNKEKDYPILKTVPEEQETEFIYDNYIYNYSKSSYDDEIYAPSGVMKKKNHKLLIWSYYCSKESFNNLSTHIINLYAKSKIDEIWIQKIFTHENGIWKDSVLDRNKRKISSVIMKEGINLEISKTLNHFVQTEEWHLERGIPYKKSFLFYGPPGTGKSSMIKAISFELQRHIHYLNLSIIKNDQELTNIMAKINYKETILVIEDIDAQDSIVHKRVKNLENNLSNINNLNNIENTNNIDFNIDGNLNTSGIFALTQLINSVSKQNNDKDNNKQNESKSQLTLSGILNQIDGVHNNHGMILIMTTNYPEKLDEALIRDGRVDEKVFFDYCDYEQIYLMFKNFYNDNIIDLETIKTYIDLTKYKVAPCNIENSMRRYYSNQMGAIDDIVNYIKGNKTFEKFEF